MATHYGYHHCPIFLATVGQKVEFCGVKFDDNHVAIEFDIPDELVKIQRYYDWSDFMYFLEAPDEFESKTHKSVLEFGHHILFACEEMNESEAYQVTVDELKEEWITGSTNYLGKIMELHNGSGGNNVLRKLDFY